MIRTVQEGTNSPRYEKSRYRLYSVHVDVAQVGRQRKVGMHASGHEVYCLDYKASTKGGRNGNYTQLQLLKGLLLTTKIAPLQKWKRNDFGL